MLKAVLASPLPVSAHAIGAPQNAYEGVDIVKNETGAILGVRRIGLCVGIG